MVEDIEIPEVRQQIRDRFLPCHNDAHMEYVSEEEEAEIYERLSQEARRYSIMEYDRDRVIRAAIKIQSIYRGFASRGPRFYTDINNIIRSGFETYEMAWLGRPKFTDKRSITFINTGWNKLSVSWVRSKGSEQPTYTSKTIVKCSQTISTLIGHWFVIRDENRHDYEKFVRIPHNFKGGCFDINTGTSFSREHWLDRRSLPDGGTLCDEIDVEMKNYCNFPLTDDHPNWSPYLLAMFQ